MDNSKEQYIDNRKFRFKGQYKVIEDITLNTPNYKLSLKTGDIISLTSLDTTGSIIKKISFTGYPDKEYDVHIFVSSIKHAIEFVDKINYAVPLENCAFSVIDVSDNTFITDRWWTREIAEQIARDHLLIHPDSPCLIVERKGLMKSVISTEYNKFS